MEAFDRYTYNLPIAFQFYREEKNGLEAKRKKIDAEIERIVQQKKEVNELEAELKKREEIVMKKEMLLSEKYGLEMKKLRSSQMLNKVSIKFYYEISL